MCTIQVCFISRPTVGWDKQKRISNCNRMKHRCILRYFETYFKTFTFNNQKATPAPPTWEILREQAKNSHLHMDRMLCYLRYTFNQSKKPRVLTFRQDCNSKIKIIQRSQWDEIFCHFWFAISCLAMCFLWPRTNLWWERVVSLQVDGSRSFILTIKFLFWNLVDQLNFQRAAGNAHILYKCQVDLESSNSTLEW